MKTGLQPPTQLSAPGWVEWVGICSAESRRCRTESRGPVRIRFQPHLYLIAHQRFERNGNVRLKKLECRAQPDTISLKVEPTVVSHRGPTVVPKWIQKLFQTLARQLFQSGPKSCSTPWSKSCAKVDPTVGSNLTQTLFQRCTKRCFKPWPNSCAKVGPKVVSNRGPKVVSK